MMTHQLTYQNEKIIGWAVQDGYCIVENTLKFKAVDINDNPNILQRVLQDLRSGIDEPDGTQKVDVGSNDVHVWLTFVTESGRIFDMDLSAFQFGLMKPHPRIHQVALGDPLAFGGTVRRSALMSDDIWSFAKIILELAEIQSNLVATLSSTTPDKNNLSAKILLQNFGEINDHVIRSAPVVISKFEDPAYFWNMIKNHHVD